MPVAGIYEPQLGKPGTRSKAGVDSSEPITTEQILPRPGRLLIRRAERPEKSAGGIVLPDTARGSSQLGEVIACGRDTEDFTPGMMVVFSIFGSTAIGMVASADLSEDLVVVRQEDVLAVVTQ